MTIQESKDNYFKYITKLIFQYLIIYIYIPASFFHFLAPPKCEQQIIVQPPE